MILGRKTVIWLAFFTVLFQFLKQMTPALLPSVDIGTINLFWDGLTALTGAGIALIANEQLTPVSDPRLDIGQAVNVGQSNPGVVVPADSGIRGVPANVEVVEAPAVVFSKGGE